MSQISFVQGAPFAEVPNLGYGPIAVLIIVVLSVGLIILALSHGLPKAKRKGVEKDQAYESGVPPIGDARRRFNVKFYLVAMMFLIFDVELIFMYPWAVAFINEKQSGQSPETLVMLFWVMMIFFIILTLGFLYEWGKGVLRYD